LAIGFGDVIFLGMGIAHPLWALAFVLLGAGFMAGLGIVAGIFANKFDQMAAMTNFIVTPLAFLSGTFYSVDTLPTLLRQMTHFNPIFYMIDGMRYGMIGVSDSSPYLGLAVSAGSVLAVVLLAWAM